MPEIPWSKEAEYDLETVVTDPAVREQLRRNAEEILHDIPPPPRGRRADEGSDAQIMWHRGVTHDNEWHAEQVDGPQNYFLFYRRRNLAPGFEVLAVRSVQQIGGWWEQMAES